MVRPLLDQDVISEAPELYLHSIGQVFAEFRRSQDSGNVSYGVQIDGDRYFVKTAGDPATTPFLTHAERVGYLRNAAVLAQSIQHPLLPRLYRVIESPEGPMLVYEWRDGELVGVPNQRRADPASSFQRFRSLPVPIIIDCLNAIYALHEELALLGWIANDFYDGCLIYNFTTGQLTVMVVLLPSPV